MQFTPEQQQQIEVQFAVITENAAFTEATMKALLEQLWLDRDPLEIIAANQKGGRAILEALDQARHILGLPEQDQGQP